MNINVQRWVDRWAGIPLCAAVSMVDALMRRFGPPAANGKPPRAIVVILLSEMGSLVLANDMFARLKQRYPDAQLHALLFRKNREILDLMRVMDPANVHTVDDRSLASLLASLGKAIGELLGPMLASIHNLHYYLNLMQEMRAALDAGRFAEFAIRFKADRQRGV